MYRDRGFTIIELMTTLGIAAIAITITVPNLQSLIMNSKQTGSINEMVSGMHLARNAAITTNSRVTMCASSNGSSCQSVGWDKGWIAFVDLDSDGAVDDNETILRAGMEAEGLSYTASGFTNFLMYRPNGRAMGANINTSTGEFSVCDERGPDHAKVVIIGLSGRPRVDKVRANGGMPMCSVSGV